MPEGVSPSWKEAEPGCGHQQWSQGPGSVHKLGSFQVQSELGSRDGRGRWLLQVGGGRLNKQGGLVRKACLGASPGE